MPAKRAFWTLLGGLAVFLAAACTFNVAVDPLGMIHRLPLTAKGQFRDCSYKDRRTIKSLQLHNGPWDGLIVGNSREEQGMDPDRPVFGDMMYYNAALPGSTWEDYRGLIVYGHETTGYRHLVMGMDLIPFAREKRAGGGDFNRSPLAGHSPMIAVVRYVFNLQTMLRSWQWLKQPLASIVTSGAGRVCKTNGSRYKGTNLFNTDFEKNFRLSTARQVEVAKNRFKVYEETVSPRIPELESTLRSLLFSNVRIDLFVPPLHALGLEHYYVTGHDREYNRFRRDVLDVVERLQRNPSFRDKISFWDFTGYNEMTTEKVPGIWPGAPGVMRWFWDPMHMSQGLGDLVFCRIMEDRPSGCSKPTPAGFGVRLSSDMITEHENAIEADRRTFLSANPEVAKLFQNLKSSQSAVSADD